MARQIEAFFESHSQLTERARKLMVYLDPLEHALVLYCDQRTQIQALDRTSRACHSNAGKVPR